MALSADRQGVLYETIHGQTRVKLAADAVAYRGALMSFDAAGHGVPAADTAAQADRKIVMALHGADNTGGQAGDHEVLCVTRGTILVPKGALVAADRGKVAHAADDNTAQLSSTNNRAFGRIIDVRDDVIAVEMS